MKPTRFVILFILMSVHFAVQSQKQEYKPISFPMEDGTVWCEYTQYLGSPEYFDHYMLYGDTLIGDTLFKLVFRFANDHCQLDNESQLLGWIGEKERKVYYKKHAADEFFPTRLLYDFNLNKGDKIFVEDPFSEIDYAEVEDVDTVFLGNQWRKRIHLCYTQWIEGIGSGYGLLFNLVWRIPTGFSPFPYLTAVLRGKEYLFGPDGDDNCFFSGLHPAESTVPDYEIKSVSGHIEIRFTGAAYESVSVVDMQGKVLNQIKNENKESLVIPTTGYTKGLYLLLLERGDKRSVSKVAI